MTGLPKFALGGILGDKNPKMAGLSGIIARDVEDHNAQVQNAIDSGLVVPSSGPSFVPKDVRDLQPKQGLGLALRNKNIRTHDTGIGQLINALSGAQEIVASQNPAHQAHANQFAAERQAMLDRITRIQGIQSPADIGTAYRGDVTAINAGGRYNHSVFAEVAAARQGQITGFSGTSTPQYNQEVLSRHEISSIQKQMGEITRSYGGRQNLDPNQHADIIDLHDKVMGLGTVFADSAGAVSPAATGLRTEFEGLQKQVGSLGTEMSTLRQAMGSTRMSFKERVTGGQPTPLAKDYLRSQGAWFPQLSGINQSMYKAGGRIGDFIVGTHRNNLEENVTTMSAKFDNSTSGDMARETFKKVMQQKAQELVSGTKFNVGDVLNMNEGFDVDEAEGKHIGTVANARITAPVKDLILRKHGSVEAYQKDIMDTYEQTIGSGAEGVSEVRMGQDTQTVSKSERSKALKVSRALQGHSFKVVSLQMGALGLQFSTMGFLTSIEGAISKVTGALSDLGSAMKSIAIMDAFGGSNLKSADLLSKIFTNGESAQSAFIEGWKKLQALTATSQVLLGGLAAKVFDKIDWESFTQDIMNAFDQVDFKSIADSIIAIFNAFVSVLPDILNALSYMAVLIGAIAQQK